MNWNDERVELLRKLWAEGQSASQIAAQLGGVSRNAVIGKVHRLKLSSRGRANAAPARQKKTSHGSAVTKAVDSRRGDRQINAGFHRRDRLANSVRGSAGHPPLYTPRRAGRGTHLAPAPTGSAQRTHVQVAQWRPAVGRFQFLRQRLFGRPLLHLSLADRVSAGVRAAAPQVNTRQPPWAGNCGWPQSQPFFLNRQWRNTQTITMTTSTV